MPINLWLEDGVEEWIALDGMFRIVDRDADLQSLKTKHQEKRLTFVLVRR